MPDRIDQPRGDDLVGNPILVAGVAAGFEGTKHYRITDGHTEITGFFQVGANGYAQFHLAVDVSGADFRSDRLLVQIIDYSQGDDGEDQIITIPVLYGPRIVKDYGRFLEHRVVAGETLSGIARHFYGDGSLYPRIVRANPSQIADPDRITPGQVLRVPLT
jgi:hypothetical protein